MLKQFCANNLKKRRKKRREIQLKILWHLLVWTPLMQLPTLNPVFGLSVLGQPENTVAQHSDSIKEEPVL